MSPSGLRAQVIGKIPPIVAISISPNSAMIAVPTPPRSDASWRELLTGQRDPQHANLATRLVVGHLRQSVRMDTTVLDAALRELYHYHTSCDPAERAQFLRYDLLAAQDLRPFMARNLLLTAKETSELIETGAFIVIAGTEEELASLPPGNWIGGTTGYIMAPGDHIARPGSLMCSVLEAGVECRIAVLTRDTLSHITDGRYENGVHLRAVARFQRGALQLRSHGSRNSWPVRTAHIRLDHRRSYVRSRRACTEGVRRPFRERP